MRPELFEIPFIGISVKSYGFMLVIGFLAAVYIIRRLTPRIKQDPDQLTNVALYALIIGIVGSRLFYVLHYFEQFKGNLLEVFAVWNGGLELAGGVILSLTFMVIYLWYKKLPLLSFLDLLAIGLMVGLGFGRIGCFLNGCCFGKPTHCPVSVQFPYDSFSYNSQVRPDSTRDRMHAHLDLPVDYFGYEDTEGDWISAPENQKYQYYLKPYEKLSEQQKHEVKDGKYQALPVHPTQLYSTLNAFSIGFLLYLFFRFKGMNKPGTTFAMMFILYGPMRFLLEMLREGNPFEYGWWTIRDGLTISQNIGLYLAILGLVSFFYLWFRKSKHPPSQETPLDTDRSSSSDTQ